MKAIIIQQHSAALHLSLDELVVINNALNEVVNGAKGCPSTDDAECLLDGFGSVIDRVCAMQRPLAVNGS